MTNKKYTLMGKETEKGGGEFKMAEVLFKPKRINSTLCLLNVNAELQVQVTSKTLRKNL